MRIQTALALITILVTLGCASTVKQNRNTILVIEGEDQKTIETARASTNASSIYSTALGSQKFDTALLERVVKQKASQALTKALLDVLTQTSSLADSMVARDLIDSIASLASSAVDGDARSQTIISALARDGLSVAIAVLARKAVSSAMLSDEGCATSTDAAGSTLGFVGLLDSAYVGLARSSALAHLGFPQVDLAEPKLASKQCVTFSLKITRLIESIARIPTEIQSLASISSTMTTAFGRVVSSCAPDEKPVAGITPSVMAAIQRGSGKTVAAMGELYNNLRLVSGGTNPLVSAECIGAARDFLGSYERYLADLVPDVKANITLTELQTEIDEAKKPIADVGKIDQNIVFRTLRSLLTRLTEGKPLRRGDIVSLTTWLEQNALNRLSDGLGKDLLASATKALPQSVKEDTHTISGLRIDVPKLVTTLTAEFEERRSVGFYLRATVGAGYIAQAGLRPAFYEELGFGYRVGNSRALFGPHVMASGLLFAITSQDKVEDRAFFGGGLSLNLYRLIEVSANIGALVDITAKDPHPESAAMVGVQVPLIDYISAAASAASETIDSASSSEEK